MIRFRSLRWKNFLSTGDSFTEINLSSVPSTLVIGQNGAGKSTMLDALSFALFGKAHRNINKNQLVNSINGKKCLVEVEFVVNGSNYKIVRGIKPAKFEIWRDDTLVNQDSHNKEYQKVLEQNILKLNHKSFHQIVVLGSSSFVPFMQLPAQHRREVIEDLLDINVFSKMNGLLKERSAVLRENINQNLHEIELVQTKIDAQKKHIAELQKISDNQRKEQEGELKNLQSELARLEKEIDDYTDEVLKRCESEIANLTTKAHQLEKYIYQFQTSQKQLDKEIKFYENNETCPSCDQSIDEGLKQEKIEKASGKRSEYDGALDQAKSQHGKVVDELNQVEEQQVTEINLSQNIQVAKRDVERVRQRIESIHRSLSELDEGSNMDSLQTAKSDMETQTGIRETLADKREVLSEEREYNSVITELLKDTGIKTKIIKQYLPVINKLTNKYLQVLDFYVSFQLDDTFKESIKSRHRDEFSYDSFSEGEKQRIDLALLFTWRQVAKMKNSVATNLLVLDETFDSSLDADGVDNLTKILDTLDDDTNVFIISHKGELLDGKFDSKIEFVKRKNFSQIA